MRKRRHTLLNTGFLPSAAYEAEAFGITEKEPNVIGRRTTPHFVFTEDPVFDIIASPLQRWQREVQAATRHRDAILPEVGVFGLGLLARVFSTTKANFHKDS